MQDDEPNEPSTLDEPGRIEAKAQQEHGAHQSQDGNYVVDHGRPILRKRLTPNSSGNRNF